MAGNTITAESANAGRPHKMFLGSWRLDGAPGIACLYQRRGLSRSASSSSASPRPVSPDAASRMASSRIAAESGIEPPLLGYPFNTVR